MRNLINLLVRKQNNFQWTKYIFYAKFTKTENWLPHFIDMKLFPKISRRCKKFSSSRSWEDVEKEFIMLSFRAHLDPACKRSLFADETSVEVFLCFS